MVFGVSDYAPVPSDALAIRQADTDARERLAVAVQGYRYQLINNRFALAPGVVSEAALRSVQFVSRDAVRIDDLTFYLVQVAAAQKSVWPDSVRDELPNGSRYELRLTLSPAGDTIQPQGGGTVTPIVGESRGPVTIARLREAIDMSLRQALRLHHREGALQASGRIFLTSLTPELTPDMAGPPLPADPGDSATRDPEYRYRLGRAMVPTTGNSMRFKLVVIILTDRLF